MYQNKSDLPETLREYLPDELQDIYLDAYQKSWQEYEEAKGGEMNREGVAHRDAMRAVQQEHVYSKVSGKWHLKGEEPEEEMEEAEANE